MLILPEQPLSALCVPAAALSGGSVMFGVSLALSSTLCCGACNNCLMMRHCVEPVGLPRQHSTPSGSATAPLWRHFASAS